MTDEIEHPGEPDVNLERQMRTWATYSIDVKNFDESITVVAIPVTFLLDLLDRVRILERAKEGGEG